MMARFEDRAPLECTKSSSKKKLYVCPHCKTGQYKSVDWFSGTCSNCKEYFNTVIALMGSAMKRLSESTKLAQKSMNNLGTVTKEGMERKADEFKNKVKNQIADGTQRSHEPNGKKRRW